MYISGTTRSSFTGVSVRVANGHGSVLLWRLCDMLCIRYDTRCYFNVRSKADISQLNLPHGNRQLKSVKPEKKLKSTWKSVLWTRHIFQIMLRLGD